MEVWAGRCEVTIGGLAMTPTPSLSKPLGRRIVVPANQWWKGARGEWYVVAQGVLLLLVMFGPRTIPQLPHWTPAMLVPTRVAGWALMAAGAALSLAAMLKIGRNLTPVPYPKDGARLAETGAYRLVRHPMYCGLIVASLGWGLLVHGWLTIGYAVLLFAFFDVKSRREEQWLLATFPGYEAYRKRVRKLIPFVY
jgi:protein-S-isoprenylcysteine O-methyltransferase Ste14